MPEMEINLMDTGVLKKWVSSLEEVTDFIEDPRLLDLLKYWIGKRAGRPVPSRQDIDASEIGALLSSIYLVDFEEPDMFRYRLAGTAVAETFGHGNLKGKTLDDILSPSGRDFVTGRWLPVIREGAIVCMKGQVYNSVNRFAFGERQLLPLSEEPGGPVTGLLGVTISRWVERLGPVERRNSDMILFPAAKIP
tara:strand:- start:92 stop:670 length:579 start_codon:yes stop_codon:yes gene_type:complete